MLRRLAVLCALLLCSACSEPPQKEIDRAQGAIDAARAAGAERYAPAEFTAATEALTQAHDAVAQRDYRTALSRALTASERAQEAARQAADGKARARSEAEGAVNAANNSAQQLRSAIKSAETQKSRARQIAAARKTLQEARTALDAEGYEEVRRNAGAVSSEIAAAIRTLDPPAPAATRSRKR